MKLVTIYIVHEVASAPGGHVLASAKAAIRRNRYVIQDGEDYRPFFFKKVLAVGFCDIAETPTGAMKRYRARLRLRIAHSAKEYHEAKRKLDAFEAWKPLRSIRGGAQ
jgi:hypothetical protein